MTESITTLAAIPFYVSGRYPKPQLLRRCQPDDIEELSSQEFFDRVRDFSLGLGVLGVEHGDRVAIVSDPRPEWVVSDFAILTGGYVSVPIYPTLPAAQMRYILADSSVRVAVVADDVQAEKVISVWAELPNLLAVVVMDSDVHNQQTEKSILGFDAVQDRGHERLITGDGVGRIYKEYAKGIQSDALATIIYTSGTTGEPKGVMLSHGNVMSNINDVDAVVKFDSEDEALSFLPLSHAFERTAVMLFLYKGLTVTFAESLDTIARDLQRVKPTVMTGVPRVFEKLYAKIHATVAEAPPLRQRLFHWAIGVGKATAQAQLARRKAPWFTTVQEPLADRLVLSKVRQRLGGRIRFLISGSAPLSVEVAEFLFAVGIPVLEGYGLTETAPVLTVNPEGRQKLGTVGTAIPQVTLRIADDGEILARGPNITSGYYRKQSETDEAIQNGWFHTGDIGFLDEEGYLTITDRKKELIVTAGGKNIAPNPIEASLKRSPLISEAMLVGDRRPYIVALLLPDLDALEVRVPAVGTEGTAIAEVVKLSHVEQLFGDVVEAVNEQLPRHEQVKRWAILPAEFSIATGELTPTLKLKRRVVVERWSSVIDQLYT